MAVYTPTGPFNPGAAPGMSAAFLNNVENFLVQVTSAATDSNITSDGAGGLTATGLITFTASLKVGSKLFMKDVGGTYRDTLYINSSDNDTHLYASPANNRIHFTNSDLVTDMAFIDANGVRSKKEVYIGNNSHYNGDESGGTVRPILYVDTSNRTTLQQAGSGTNIDITNNAGGVIGYFAPGDSYNSGQLYDQYGNRVCGTSTFSGTGTGTYNHGYQHYTPSGILAMPNFNGTMTMGYDSLGSSTVHITCGASQAFTAVACHT